MTHALRDAPPVVIACMLPEEAGSGVNTHIRQLLGFLEKHGVPGHLVTPFSWGKLLHYPVFGPRRVLRHFNAGAAAFWYRHWHEVFLRKALRKRVEGLGGCVIYAQGPAEAQAALRVRRGPHQRVVMAVHYPVSQADEWCRMPGGPIKRGGLVWRWMRQAEQATIPKVDGLVFVSHWARQQVLNWLTEAGSVPTAIIGNFVSAVQPKPAEEPLRDLVSTGGLSTGKNHRFLLEVLAEAKRVGRSLTLDVYGDGSLRQELLDMTRSLGLEAQVRFRGFCPNVRDFLPGYRIYVHSSLSETSSLAIMEAMCAGLPIIAARVGAIPELLDEGVEGRFWDLTDPAKAAVTLLGLLDNEPERQVAAKAARARFSRDFDADVVVPRLLSFLHDTMPADAPWLVTAQAWTTA